MEGWVKLWRKVFDSQVWQNKNLWRAWTYCLLKASHKKRWVSVKTGRAETEVEISPGQFIFGRHVAAKETKLKPSTINFLMHKLQSMQNIDIQVDTHYSIISIINWDSYQSSFENNRHPTGHPIDTQLTPNGQAIDTDKNVKKDKNVKNKEEDVSVSKKKTKTSYPADEQFLLSLKDLYPYIDINQELNKMKAWMMTPKGRGRQLNRRFIINWLNKIDKPISTGEIAPINEQDKKSWEIKKALDKIKWKEKENEHSEPT